MKEGTSTFQNTILSLSSSLESKNGGKYMGLIESNFFKTIRVDLLRLFSYTESQSSEFKTSHNVIFFIRLLQLFAPS